MDFMFMFEIRYLTPDHFFVSMKTRSNVHSIYRHNVVFWSKNLILRMLEYSQKKYMKLILFEKN